MRLHPFATLTSLVALLATTSGTAGAQGSTHVGMRVGYNFDTEEMMFSGNLTVPMTRRLEFYPSLDIYTPSTGNKIGFNGDLKFRFPTVPGPQFYLGGGLGIVNRNERDFSDTDVGANFLVGLESRSGWIHPFAEGKVLVRDRSQFQLIGGLNLTLGR